RVIEHQVAELAAVGAGGVQADQRNPLPRLLEIDAMGAATQLQPQVAANNGFERSHGCLLPRRRGSVSKSFRYCRLAITGCRSPSSAADPQPVMANLQYLKELLTLPRRLGSKQP